MIGVFELFKIGLGPSSSHSVGPMKAAKAFRDAVESAGLAPRVARVSATLFGSLAFTGRGHATDKAILVGLAGETPEHVDPDAADAIYARALGEGRLAFLSRELTFDPARDMVYDTKTRPPFHPNTLALAAADGDGALLLEQRWCSIGGGFIV